MKTMSLQAGRCGMQNPAPVSASSVLEGISGYPSGDTVDTHPDRDDWQWQLRNRIRNLNQLRQRFPELATIVGIPEAAARFPLAITPYYASLIERADDSDPIFRMSIPQLSELYDPPCLLDDPLEEDMDMPVPGLVRRYPDRALLLATSACAMYCRYCTRKRVSGQRETCISNQRLERVVRYLHEHPEIKDLIVSGGDPLTMSDQGLESVVAAARSVKTVEIIRIHSRTPVTMPMRISQALVDMLKQYQPIFFNTHFNHPRELTPEARAACGRIVDAGIPLGNQSVLLRGVNDDPQILETLFRSLLSCRVRPYYLFQCDLVRGVEHFRTPISRGIEIMEYLRGRLDGMAIPSYVVDTPHGGGKMPLLPNYIISTSPSHTVLRNFEGMIVSYPEPFSNDRQPATRNSSATPGVWELATGRASQIRPEKTVRHQRRDREAAASATTRAIRPARSKKL